MLYKQKQKLLPPLRGEEFLPPVSRWTSLAGITLLGSVAAAITLASWAEYNVTVRAPANVRPAGETKVVQSATEGTVKSIQVKGNQRVRKGDIIAYLDNEELKIKQSQLVGNIRQYDLQISQINHQIRTLDAQILSESRVIDQAVGSAEADLERNQKEYQERKATTTSELLAARANLQKAQAELQKSFRDLEFAKTDYQRYQQLLKDGVISEQQVDQKKLAVQQASSAVEAQKKVIDIAQTQIQKAEAAVNPSNATVNIAQKRIEQEKAKGETTLATLKKEKHALTQRRAEIQNQLQQYQKELLQIENQIQDNIIQATTDGFILTLNLRNPGQVVRAGESIAQIVPKNAPLEIKVMVPTGEIKKVAKGQEVHLRINSCEYPDYGTLKGTVSNISPDAITPQTENKTSTTPAASYFEVTVKPESHSFGNGNRQCLIKPGIDGTADIISRSETPLQFILRKARLISDL